MKQEFVTLYGKVIIQNDKLFIRSFYLPFYKTAFVRIAIEVIWIIILLFILFYPEEGAKRKVEILFFSVMTLLRLPIFYEVFFKKSYVNRILFDKIKSFTVEDDYRGLQTIVKLYLKNGRYRKIYFRKLENQVEPFTELLSHHIVQTQFA